MHGIDDHLGQHGDIARTQVEPLPGNRVQGVNGIADQCQPSGDRTLRAQQAQGPGLASARARQPAQPLPEAFLQLAQECGIVQCHDGIGLRARHRPHHGATPFRHRQARQAGQLSVKRS